MSILLPEDMARPLPKMYRVRQQFDETRLEDIAGTVRREMEKDSIRTLVKPGMRVAVGVGSRGIQNLPLIVRGVLDGLKNLGAEPFVVSAMGSHGSGTEEGQREVLREYGITEESMGVPVVTSVDTVFLGNCKNGRPVWFDRASFEADMVVPINRVKLHTDFVGELQSGLCKMLVIGLGNQKGCSAVHNESFENFSDVLEETARLIIKKAPIGFGVAILENAYDQTLAVETLPAETLVEREKELVQIAKENFPYIMIPKADVIVCDTIGKDVCGAGFDPNVLGRSTVRTSYLIPIPEYQRLVLLDLTEATNGNGIGVGLFDVITKKVAEQLDYEAMYVNAIASNFLSDVKVPCTVEDGETALRVALKCCHDIDRDNPRIIHIENTLHLGEIEISEALLPEIEKNPRLSIVESAES